MKAHKIAAIVGAIEVIKEQSMCHLADGSDSEKVRYYRAKMDEIVFQVNRLDNNFCGFVDSLIGKE